MQGGFGVAGFGEGFACGFDFVWFVGEGVAYVELYSFFVFAAEDVETDAVGDRF